MLLYSKMTTTLVVDYDNIIKGHKLQNIVDKIKPIPDSKYPLGVILTIPKNIYEILDNKPKGKERVAYIDTDEFIGSITDYTFVIYKSKKKSCEIIGKIAPATLISLLYTFPNDIVLYTKVDNSNISHLVKLDFHSPFICNENIYMVHENTVIDTNKSQTTEQIRTLYESNKEKHCNIIMVIGDYTRKFFKNLSQMGSTLNSNGTITQKEVAGRLSVTNPTDEVKIIEVDKDSLINGSEEGVSIVGGIINFHSHPRDAYDRHDTTVGWPSGQDYIGFFYAALLYGTICHFVIAIEGVYFITFSEEWLSYSDKFGKKVVEFIDDEFSICKEGNNDNNTENNTDNNYNDNDSCSENSDDERVNTAEEYLASINGKRYNGLQIFSVGLIKWEQLNEQITIIYPKTGMYNCFTCDETAKHYKNLCIS